jgi:hypothetical protein
MLDRSSLRKAFLREGLTSYLDAVVAIDEFTRLIQENCRLVLERQLTTMQEASGLKFSLKELVDYSEPYRSQAKLWSGQYAWIGTELPVSNSPKFHSVDIGLAWNYESGAISIEVYSSLYTNQLSVLNELGAKMRRWTKSEYEVDKIHYGLILWGENATGPDGEYSLEPFEKMVHEWISIWKQAGGAARMLSDDTRKK